MKNSIRLVKIAQKDAYNDVLDSLSQKSKDRKNEAMSNSNDKAQRYKFLKQKAEEMGISVAEYVNHFGSFDDKKNFSNLANQQSASQKPVPEDNSIQGYEKVLNAFQFIKEKSEELNIPIIRIWEDIQLPSEIKNKVLTLVVNYQRLQEANQERKVQNNISQSGSLEDRLKKATENARFYSEQWNQAIDDAKNQNIDPIVYISAHYPDDLAQQIIAWYKIKTGEIDATNMEEYFAQSVEQISNQEVESFNENYDDTTFQNFVDKARELAENIDWEKAGAYLDEGKNRVIYQLLKPGSFIKKTSDSIKVIISMLTLKNVEKFNDEYYENQNNTQRAEQELDDYLRTSKMNTRTVIASLNKVANELDNSGMFEEANEITNVMKRISQAQPWSFKPEKPMTAKPGMNANEVVYKVLRNNFGPDYNNMKDLKIKIRDNYSSLSSQIQALAQESGVNSQSASQRLKQVMDASSWHSEANKPAMYGQGGGTSVFDPTQKVNDSSIDKTPGQMGLETKAFDWIAANGGDGAEKAIQKAVAQTQARKMSPVMLNQIKALLQPRVDKEYNRLKALQGTAAGAMGSFSREPKPFAIGD